MEIESGKDFEKDIAFEMRSIVHALEEELGHRIIEGSASAAELAYLNRVVKENGSKSVGQTGFHTGFSATAFLLDTDVENVTSFDIKEYGYVEDADKLVDEKFPNRHTLVGGDSTKTLPEFAKENEGVKFDTIFIDGGHSFEVAWADLMNMRKFAHEGTDVIMDDLVNCPTKPWGRGPRRAWQKAIKEGIIVQHELFEESKHGVKQVDKIGFCSASRAWARGRFVF